MHGDRRLRGRVEAYSCKASGADKKLKKHLDQHYMKEYVGSPNTTPSPAIGLLSDPSKRRLLINLICTLNATFQDYDFSSVKPTNFSKENLGMVINLVNTNLSELVAIQNGRFLEQLWSSIDQVINLKQVEVYSYIHDLEDPFNIPGSLWSFNYFFFNASEKKIVFFTCCCSTASKIGDDIYGLGENEEEDFVEDDDASETLSKQDVTEGDLLEGGFDIMHEMDMDSDSEDEWKKWPNQKNETHKRKWFEFEFETMNQNKTKQKQKQQKTDKFKKKKHHQNFCT